MSILAGSKRWHRCGRCDTVDIVTEAVLPWPDLRGRPFDEAAK